jgi:hypothetical protein
MISLPIVGFSFVHGNVRSIAERLQASREIAFEASSLVERFLMVKQVTRLGEGLCTAGHIAFVCASHVNRLLMVA